MTINSVVSLAQIVFNRWVQAALVASAVTVAPQEDGSVVAFDGGSLTRFQLVDKDRIVATDSHSGRFISDTLTGIQKSLLPLQKLFATDYLRSKGYPVTDADWASDQSILVAEDDVKGARLTIEGGKLMHQWVRGEIEEETPVLMVDLDAEMVMGERAFTPEFLQIALVVGPTSVFVTPGIR